MKRSMYIYRVADDTGFALCVDNDLLTLACCKGGRKSGVKTDDICIVASDKLEHQGYGPHWDDSVSTDEQMSVKRDIAGTYA